MKLTWFTTAAFTLMEGETAIAFDPFLGLPLKKRWPEMDGRAFSDASAVFVTHGHVDHILELPALLAETQRLRSALDALPGVTAEPTDTHFFLCRLADRRAADLKKWLAETHGILIRDASNFEGLDDGCFRIAAQTPAENGSLVAAVRQYLEDCR